MAVALHRHISKIDALFEKAKELQDNDELLSHWSRYLCVLVSGLLERGLSIILTTYAQDKGHINLARFVASSLKRFQNPNQEKIMQAVGSFSQAWARELEQRVPEEVWGAVNGVVADRNQIAHGEDTGVSYVVMRTWYGHVKGLLKTMDELTRS